MSWLISILFWALVAWFAARRGSWALLPTAVLQEWSEGQSSGGALVTIQGRRAGLVAFLLEAIGWDSSIRFIIRGDEIEISYTSLFGHTYHRIPIRMVSCSVTGYVRPIHFFVFGIGLVLSSAPLLLGGEKSEGLVAMINGGGSNTGLGLVLLLIAAASLAAFAFGKMSVLAVEAGSILGLHGMRFKGSLIHGRVVDLAAAQRVARLIGDLCAKSVHAADAPTPWPATEPLVPPAPPPMAHCGGCGRIGIVGQHCPSCDSLID